MKLQNLKTHMRGKAVLCNGIRYVVGADGMVEVADKDAKRLLASLDWVRCGSAKAHQEPPEPVRAVAKPQPMPPPLTTVLRVPDEPVALAPSESVAEAKEEAGEGVTGEWPDPDMTMTKSYLQEMAVAYEVPGGDTLTKKELITAIFGKMYD